MPIRILVVDDDPAMVGAITALVGTEGHQVVTAYDGATAVRRWREERPDLILLDLAMPGPDGYAVARQLRDAGAIVPIIVVSGEIAEAAKVRALDLGADDYLTKPFGKDEMLARIRAALRRAAAPSAARRAAAPSAVPDARSLQGGPSGALEAGSLTIDRGRHIVRAAGRALDLTPIEYRLLEALALHGGEVVLRDALLRAGWPDDADPDPLWLKPHLARLRRKLRLVGGPPVVSVRAVGWRLGL